jgi:hypothetical protein
MNDKKNLMGVAWTTICCVELCVWGVQARIHPDDQTTIN